MLGQIVIYEKHKTSISWKDIGKSLRVEEKVFTCLKSSIHYANQTNPVLFLISNAEKKKMKWELISSLVQSHLNISSRKYIVSPGTLAAPVFPVIEPDAPKIIDSVEHIIHQQFIAKVLKEHRGLPVNGGKVMLGQSPSMVKLFHTILKRSVGNENCLIFGETGTGKTITAEALHTYNPERAKHPLDVITVGEVNETVFESEFFGAKKGAYTSCNSDRPGIFDRSEGTLLIDEIGNLPLDCQKKLLRALGDKKYKPVGGQDSKDINARMVFATNKDLDKLVEGGQFMEDLLYRIQRLKIEMPALHDRKSDIPLLVQDRLSLLNRQFSKAKKITPEALKFLTLYSWPGNVRELHAKLETAFIESNGSDITPDSFQDIDIEPSFAIFSMDTPDPVVEPVTIALSSANSRGQGDELSISIRLTEALKTRGMGRKEFAKAIGTSEATVCRLLKKNPKSEKELIGVSADIVIRAKHWIKTGGFLPSPPKPAKQVSSEDKIKTIMKNSHIRLIDLASHLKKSKQIVYKWLKRIDMDENGNFISNGIPKETADIIITILKTGEIPGLSAPAEPVIFDSNGSIRRVSVVSNEFQKVHFR